ncbi:MFS transporter [Spirosoma soli]|uniref:MFS transporter n=1 Tax=Spirosoma soli TaxID=1770529 RepID=A0ABW5M2J8_9BACT
MKDYRLVLIFAISIIDVVAANGLGALATKFVVALPNKPLLLTGGTALMLCIQLAFSPSVGLLSDKIGRRPVVIGATIASLFTSLFLLPVQTWGYLTNRVAKGSTNGLYAVMRSAASDILDKDELIKYSSILSFIIGTGVIVGPMVTGLFLLAFPDLRIDARPTVLFLIALGALNILLAFLFKETSDKEKEKVDIKELRDKALNSLKVVTLWQQLGESDKQLPGIKAIFILNMLGTLSFGYYNFFIAFLTQSDINMDVLGVARFFVFFGALSLLANVVFFRFIVNHVDKQKTIIAIVSLGIVLQILYIFSESSVTLLYVVAGVDAITVSLIGGLIGGILTRITKEGGGVGEMFGNIQALGGVASFVTALVNSLLAGVSTMAPFIFCAISSAVVIWWTTRLPEETKKYTQIRQEGPEEPEPAGA